ncbi:DUF4232 domain-containing protein [Streptomyces bauhiniae]|uniref:DUF4232 domain-containing protein n=1 Tax=Streptomyces bauhiniae TaxID=2340725 RepID=A0A7K3QS94_9ACTN|nr:DUF4232 domain-containing protein [Streptomyces bauhiniae]NEB92778.1 DUF4232 domain-containing protein [Streptomyces bauhiniae]
MRRRTRTTAVVAALAATTVTGSAMASASPAKPSVRPCTMNNVSFYFGGYSYGLSHRSFDVTLLAHDGITCSLSDTPRITFGSPPDQTAKIPVTVNGRGGTLVLRPDSPLHATVRYSVPDAPENKAQVNALQLAMPDGTSRSTSFLFPGTTDIYKGGILVTSWETGIGMGQAEGV